jgi:hypothetical protein
MITVLKLESRGFILGRARIFSWATSSRHCPVSYLKGGGGEVDHSASSRAEVKVKVI